MRAELAISHSSKQGQNMTQRKVTGWGSFVVVWATVCCIGICVQCHILCDSMCISPAYDVVHIIVSMCLNVCICMFACICVYLFGFYCVWSYPCNCTWQWDFEFTSVIFLRLCMMVCARLCVCMCVCVHTFLWVGSEKLRLQMAFWGRLLLVLASLRNDRRPHGSWPKSRTCRTIYQFICIYQKQLTTVQNMNSLLSLSVNAF